MPTDPVTGRHTTEIFHNAEELNRTIRAYTAFYDSGELAEAIASGHVPTLRPEPYRAPARVLSLRAYIRAFGHRVEPAIVRGEAPIDALFGLGANVIQIARTMGRTVDARGIRETVGKLGPLVGIELGADQVEHLAKQLRQAFEIHDLEPGETWRDRPEPRDSFELGRHEAGLDESEE